MPRVCRARPSIRCRRCLPSRRSSIAGCCASCRIRPRAMCRRSSVRLILPTHRSPLTGRRHCSASTLSKSFANSVSSLARRRPPKPLENQMPRLHLPTVAEMTPEQRAVHDEIVSGVRGQLIGPLRAVIHSPDLARRWSRLGEYLRFSTCLPKRLNELAIIVTGRRWNSQLEFHIHSEAAKVAGLDPACIEAIRLARVPVFADEAEVEVYEFARQLQQTGNV